MRNLSLWKSRWTTLPGHTSSDSLAEGFISTVALDVDESAAFLAYEYRKCDITTAVEIWRLKDEESPQQIAKYAEVSSGSPNPWSSDSQITPAIVSALISMRFASENRALILVVRAGDIVTLSVDEEDPQFEVVGSVEAGILAASWSPDDSLLVLVTGDDKLILMTSTFDVLSEGPMHTGEFGEDAPIALGWGSKQTQFHGSLGKSAAQAGFDLSQVGISPDDDSHPRVSWRGDGAYFVVSTILPLSRETPRPRRILRVYNREGLLSSTGEPIAGLEHALAWRPSGNLIACSQRFGGDGLGKGREGKHDVIFFERNGLRHGEFGLREVEGHSQAKVARGAYKVKEIGWSSDSNVLSVWFEWKERDIVQLWTMGNYHWYLKQEIPAPQTSSELPGRFTSVAWHPEDALTLILTTTTDIIQRTYAWETFSSRTKPPVDSGSVAVFDGPRIQLTPFRTQNVPPPMASHTLSLDPTSNPSSMHPTTRVLVPVHSAFSSSRDLLAILWESGHVELYDLQTRLGPGRGKVMDPVRIWAGSLGDSDRGFRQIIIWNDSSIHEDQETINICALCTETSIGFDQVCAITIKNGSVDNAIEVDMSAGNGRLVLADNGLMWQGPDGELFAVDLANRSTLSEGRFPEFCFTATQVLVISSAENAASNTQSEDITSLSIGLTLSGKLYVHGQVSRSLASNVTSFTVASGSLIFTTTSHVAQFAPLKTLSTLCRLSTDALDASPPPEWETRRVERGSRIVTAVPSTMSLVLQMPRGNLETINPRPLVMEIVNRDIDNGDYGKAFSACRKHRIDLNVLVERNRTVFKEKTSLFVEQVDDPDYINLFLTGLGRGSLSPGTVSELCDEIRVELERKDLKRYISCILTAQVVKNPPDHKGALALLLPLRDSEPQLVEDAVKYIIFLVDADTLFDIALGMYDFSLVLMIAQHAQKDPREYLPFLRELRALDQYYQRFRIDDHLKRYEKALQNLSLAGSERFDEAMQYVEKHKLYEKALTIWRDTEQYKSVLDIYGDWLFECRSFREAAFVSRQAGKAAKAMIAYEKALDWQELFEIALQEEMPSEELIAMAYRVAEDLTSKKRHSEAARVLLDHAQDVNEAVKALVEGSQFSEARRIIVLNSHPDLLFDVVYPGTLECRAQIAEELGEMRDQLRKQLQRIRELRVRKIEEPDAFYGVEDMDLHNVDVMSDISMGGTAFTRYTQAPSNASKTTSKRSSRSKRKLERKVGSGRKGTIDEEEYILKSVGKLVTRFNTTQADAANLLPHLMQFTDEHQVEGQQLQEEINTFEQELRSAVDNIWTRPPTEDDGESEPPADSWTARMQVHEKQRQRDPLEKVDKPSLSKQEWTLRLPNAEA